VANVRAATAFKPARPSGQATIATVAAHAEVSRQTVSNAINAPHLLRSETLARVQNSIQELSYRPNSAARSLRTQSTRLIACRLLPSNILGTSGVLDGFLHALCLAAREFGYDVLTFSAATDAEEVAVFDDLVRRNAVDAFVLSGTHFDDPRTAWLISRKAEFVAFGRPWGQSRPRHSWVDVDGAAGVSMAVDHLVATGHRRIGFLGWPGGSGSGDDRYTGWVAAMKRHRLPTRALAVRGVNTIEDGTRLATTLLDRAQPPSALVAVSDALALGAMRAAESRQLQVGIDLALVGFDDSPVAAVLRPALTSVQQPLKAVAEAVIDLLLNHAGDRKPQGRLVQPTLAVRDSSGRPQPGDAPMAPSHNDRAAPPRTLQAAPPSPSH
jgi:DNA-binding LacI/PurR family transcriptional regulator